MRALHHIAIGARDVLGVASFYERLLGLREVARHHTPAGEIRSVWLDAAGTLLLIERSEQPEKRVDGVGTGPFLLAFQATPAEREELERALEAAGFPIEARSPHSSYARDPEGNRVAFSHYPHPSPE